MERRQMLPGERFCPMEDELLFHYLIPKVKNLPVPGGETLIPFVNLYDKNKEPWKIWEENQQRRHNDLRKNKDLYFFTTLKKASEGGERFARSVGEGGTWKGQTKGLEVFLCDGNGKKITNPSTMTLLGYKKSYIYTNENSDQNKRWILYQFELSASRYITETEIDGNKGLVLCRLRKNDKSSERKRNAERENGNEELQDEVVAVDQDPNNVNGGDVFVNAHNPNIVTQIDQRFQLQMGQLQMGQGYNNFYCNNSYRPIVLQQNSEFDLGLPEFSSYHQPLPNYLFQPPPLHTIHRGQRNQMMGLITRRRNYSANNVTRGGSYVTLNDDQVNETVQSADQVDQGQHYVQPPASRPQLNMPPPSNLNRTNSSDHFL